MNFECLSFNMTGWNSWDYSKPSSCILIGCPLCSGFIVKLNILHFLKPATKYAGRRVGCLLPQLSMQQSCKRKVRILWYLNCGGRGTVLISVLYWGALYLSACYTEGHCTYQCAILRALSLTQKISDCIAYIYITSVVTQISSYCVRFEVLIAVINCSGTPAMLCGVQILKCQYLYTTPHTVKSHKATSLLSLLQSFIFESFFLQACVDSAWFWREQKVLLTAIFWAFPYLLQVQENTGTINGDVMAAEDLCSLSKSGTFCDNAL